MITIKITIKNGLIIFILLCQMTVSIKICVIVTNKSTPFNIKRIRSPDINNILLECA